MARHGCIGNGSLLALYDENSYIKDLFFPFAGSENHVVSQTHRIAFKINNNKTFLEDLKCKSYQSSKSLKYVVKTTTPKNFAIKIENIVYNEKTRNLLKKTHFYNLTENIINVKSFFNQGIRLKKINIEILDIFIQIKLRNTLPSK